MLTDPDACARWAPVPFDVEDADGAGWPRGSRARVSGQLAGRRVGFDVEVHEADEAGLALAAPRARSASTSPTSSAAPKAAAKSAPPSPCRPGGGLAGRLLAEATGALLQRRRPATAPSRASRARPRRLTRITERNPR